jgi:hypothetical protein
MRDHASLLQHKVFINPSTSEVLCTAIAEVNVHSMRCILFFICNHFLVIKALAMGKWVVCPRISSNQFFEQFPNCLMYDDEGSNHDMHDLYCALDLNMFVQLFQNNFVPMSIGHCIMILIHCTINSVMYCHGKQR